MTLESIFWGWKGHLGSIRYCLPISIVFHFGQCFSRVEGQKWHIYLSVQNWKLFYDQFRGPVIVEIFFGIFFISNIESFFINELIKGQVILKSQCSESKRSKVIWIFSTDSRRGQGQLFLVGCRFLACLSSGRGKSIRTLASHWLESE